MDVSDMSDAELCARYGNLQDRKSASHTAFRRVAAEMAKRFNERVRSEGEL